MYQGKFDAKAKGQSAPGETLEKILKDREAAIAAKAARKAAREAAAAEAPAKKPQPVRQAPAAAPAAKPAEAPKPQAPAEAPAVKPAPVETKKLDIDFKMPPKELEPVESEMKSLDAMINPPAKPQAPAKKPQAPAAKPAAKPRPPKSEPAPKPVRAVENQKAQEPKKKGPRTGGVIFYSIYFLFIFAFFVGVFGLLNWLNGWLKAYEEAQPTIKCQEVFDQLFTNPDWAQLYRISNTEDSDFEGVEEYVTYMENKVGGQQLNFVETSAGVSSDKKYIVRLGTERLATFTLSGQGETLTAIPDWKLGSVELVIKRDQSFRIKKLENHIAYVNGVPLDDSYTVQIASTVADNMLPAGTPKIRTSIQCIDGLMTVPQIVVYDETGANRVDVVYNADTDTYEEQNDAIVMTEEERSAVFGALEAYSGFMINASGSRAGVAKYFDGSSNIYSDIIKMGSELWMNSDNGHQFQNEEIIGYTKHSDSVFSVRASLNMHVVCKDATEKDYGVTESMFFTKKNGAWVCYEMTNEDITKPVGQVRLTFCRANGEVISTDFYNTDATSLIAPVIDAPEGKTFSGWSRIETGENNAKVWTIMFRPDETGNVTLNGTALEPMTLYPLFE